MEEKDRQRIENFEDVLIEKTNFKKVYMLLLRWQVIPVNLKAFQKLSRSDKENNRILYNVIQSRGKNAFSKLTEALRLSNPELLDQFEGRPWRISNEQWVCSPQEYNLSEAKIRGSYRVVTMTDNRAGWETEEENLIKTFESLRYKGFAFPNPSEEDFNTLLNDFTATSNAGCYVFALSGHGHGSHGEESILQANKSYKRVNEILSRICKAPRLLNKPKIIILQICRGESETAKTVPHVSTGTSFITPVEIPDIKDTIILRPCLPGYVAYRDVVRGGWFIDILSKMIQKHAQDKDVEEIMIEVQKELAFMKENKTGFYQYTDQWRYMTPCVNAYSFKKFYFLPKEELSITCAEGEPSTSMNENPDD